MRWTKLKRKLGIGASRRNLVQAGGTTAQSADKLSLSQTEAISTDQIGSLEPANLSDDDVPIRDLWSLAYEKLRREDEELIRDYESKVREHLGAGVTTIGLKISLRDRLDMILRQRMDEVNQNTWKIRFGSSEIQIKDLANPILGIVNSVNEYITGFVTPSPYASIAWAGVSLLLPLFLNSSKQAASLAKGLNDISSLIVQSRMREDLYVRQFEAKDRGRNQKPALPHQEYKNSLEMLYKEILRFQATSYCYYANNDAFRLGLDMVKWDDWDELLVQIHDRERNFAAVEALWRDLKYDEECLAVEGRHKESMHQWSEIGTDLSGLRSAVERAQAEKERCELLHWLCDVDPSEMYNAARDKHGTGTGEWLTKESEEFKAWQESPASLLWLHGKAGAGKSILSSVVIKHLHDQHASNPSTALAFFFFSFSDLKKQKVNQMLSSLIKQLCSRRPDTPQPIRSLSEYRDKGQCPDTETLGSILTAVARGFSTVHIVIDALDECPPLEGERKRLLRSLRQIMAAAPAHLHVFCTSRKEADINTTMSDVICPSPKAAVIDLDAHQDILNRDIGFYIDSTLASDEFRSWPDSIRAATRSLLMEKADGMFQYVSLQLQALQRLSSARLVREALRDLPLGLDATYDRLLLSLDVAFRSQIIGCLKWLAFSNEALQLDQLAEIFILRPGSALPLDESERLFHPEDVLKYLSGLVVVQPARSIFKGHVTYIRLAHFSVKEYLISNRICKGPAKAFAFNEANAHLHIARCCLAYEFQRSDMTQQEAIALRLREYAGYQWPSHLEMVPRASWPAQIPQAAARALAMRSPVSDDEAVGATWKHLETIQLVVDEQFDPNRRLLLSLCHTARFGFLQLTDMLLSSETGTVSGSPTQRHLDEALHQAAYGGHMAIVRLCLDKGADVNSKGYFYGDALQAAAYRGHAAIVRLLLDSHADVNAQGGKWGSALQAAAQGGWLDILKLLVDRGADTDLPSNEAGCVLTSTVQKASRDSAKCLSYLLDAGADINRRSGGIHGTALHEAALRLHRAREHFHLLLRRGADVNAPGGLYGYPLQAACAHGASKADIKLLLNAGADVNAQGGFFGNALQAARANGMTEVVRMLLDRGAETDVQERGFGTMPQAASADKHSYMDSETLLPRHNADDSFEGCFSRSAWQAEMT